MPNGHCDNDTVCPTVRSPSGWISLFGTLQPLTEILRHAGITLAEVRTSPSLRGKVVVVATAAAVVYLHDNGKTATAGQTMDKMEWITSKQHFSDV